jgi:hypothetical protein
MFTDLHIDMDYTPGNSNVCSQVICCRPRAGKAKSIEQMAGLWGDYKCDLSPRVFQSMITFINDEIEPHALFWGGDSLSHDIGTATMEASISNMKSVSN